MAAAVRQSGTRKRPASAMSPSSFDQVPTKKSNNRNIDSSQTGDDPLQMGMQATQFPSHGLPDYGNTAGNFSGQYDSPYYHGVQSQAPSGTFGNELVRTQSNNQVIPAPNYADGYQVARPDFGTPLPPVEHGYQGQGQYNDLDRRALLAQRDAQGKRKQIPPFVQKLSR